MIENMQYIYADRVAPEKLVSSLSLPHTSCDANLLMEGFKMSELTQQELKNQLRYDPETGDLIWEERSAHRIYKGDVAGSIGSHGYLATGLNRGKHLNHRLVWLYHNGYLPENQIDHIDRDKTNNKIENLREVSPQCNLRNCDQFRHNTSGVKGVFWNKSKNKWGFQIMVARKNKKLGDYNDFCDAVCARLAAEQCLGWSECDSSSPACRYVKKHILRKRG